MSGSTRERIRLQLTFVVDVPAGQDLTMCHDMTDAFVAAAKALYPALTDESEIEANGKLGVTRLRPMRGRAK